MRILSPHELHGCLRSHGQQGAGLDFSLSYLTPNLHSFLGSFVSMLPDPSSVTSALVGIRFPQLELLQSKHAQGPTPDVQNEKLGFWITASHHNDPPVPRAHRKKRLRVLPDLWLASLQPWALKKGAPSHMTAELSRTYCVELVGDLQELLVHLQANLLALECESTCQRGRR